MAFFPNAGPSPSDRPVPGASIACRAARRRCPLGKMAECVKTGDTNGTLQGICPDCNRMIYRRINPQKIDAVRGDLDVTFTQAEPRIEETAKPNVNCDSTEGEQR